MNNENNDDLRPEYDATVLRDGIRGKYYQQYQQHQEGTTNLIRLAPDLARAFPDEKAVNDALRLLLRVAENTAGASPDRILDG